jgi:hypothetical protein
MIQIVIAALLSTSAYSYEGQPKNITLMPSLAQKVTMVLPALNTDDLAIEDTKCAEALCSKLARVQNNLKATTAGIEYKLLFAWVNVNRNGQLIQPLAPRALVLGEVETGTRLTLSLDETRSTACFGANSSTVCTFYLVNSTY